VDKVKCMRKIIFLLIVFLAGCKQGNTNDVPTEVIENKTVGVDMSSNVIDLFDSRSCFQAKSQGFVEGSISYPFDKNLSTFYRSRMDNYGSGSREVALDFEVTINIVINQ